MRDVVRVLLFRVGFYSAAALFVFFLALAAGSVYLSFDPPIVLRSRQQESAFLLLGALVFGVLAFGSFRLAALVVRWGGLGRFRNVVPPGVTGVPGAGEKPREVSKP